ncbi:hypothetical protein N7G274_006208 [Stereocaulon virgatum]|uniref:Secreted protein n=1 Tax=Stereocaulon virgatum TaxID=373712 RepID=A0ABR4A6E7_9LECA
MMLSSMYFILCICASFALASPFPQHDTPCVPKFQVPGGNTFSLEYQLIPLGPGMKYCDGSSGTSPATPSVAADPNPSPVSTVPQISSKPVSSPLSFLAKPGGAGNGQIGNGVSQPVNAMPSSVAVPGSNSQRPVRCGGGKTSKRRVHRSTDHNSMSNQHS